MPAPVTAIQENPLARLRRAILANKGKKVCRVDPLDRVLIESELERLWRWQQPPPALAPPGGFLVFDGVCLVEDPAVPRGCFVFSDEEEAQPCSPAT